MWCVAAEIGNLAIWGGTEPQTQRFPESLVTQCGTLNVGNVET